VVLRDDRYFEDFDKPKLDEVHHSEMEKWAKLKVRLGSLKKNSRLKQRLSKIRTAKPIIQETGEGITFKKVDPKIYGKKTYGYHKIPMHPSNAILIRPKDPKHYMDLVKHFRKIHETPDFAKYTQGTVQQTIPLNSLKNDIRHMSGDKLKFHADISTATNKAFKKGDILMRRVGGTPEKGKYGTVGETFYIEEDSPKGELFKSPTKDELHQRYNAKLRQRLSRIDISESDKFHKRYDRQRDYVSDLLSDKKSRAYDKHGEVKRLPMAELKAWDKYVDKGIKIKPKKPTRQETKDIHEARLKIGRIRKNEKTVDATIDDIIKDIKDPALKEDAVKRLNKKPTGPKNYSPSLKDKIRRELEE